jgi:predicted DsbA family dithiol-disulfide isomerase
VQIDLWSDFACPWCALGLYRLDAARREFRHDDEITVIHRAFELDPHAPARRPQSMDEVLATKYGMSPAQVRAGHEHLTALGHEVGLEFHFDRIQLGNTFDAHRLARSARGTAFEHALVSGLFAAYFTEGLLLSDHGVLVAVATEAGMDADVAAAVLAGESHAPDVRADEAAAQQLGITGVPYFLINGKWAVPGAQDIETLRLTLDRAWERSEGEAAAAGTTTN